MVGILLVVLRRLLGLFGGPSRWPPVRLLEVEGLCFDGEG